jgi:uncharacterized protein YceK
MLDLLGRAQLLSSRSFQGGGEMAIRAICVALPLSSLLIAGCGTVANLAKPGPEEGGKAPFGGVSQDVTCFKKAASGSIGFRTPPMPGSDQPPQVALMLLCAADLPFSLIGDVLTWPYTATYTCINQPVPTPPVIQAPPQPVTQATGVDGSQTTPYGAGNK